MGQLRSLFNSFAIAERTGNLEEARRFGTLALELARSMEDRAHERLALFNLTSLAITAEDLETAQSLMTEVKVLLEHEADRGSVRWAQFNRAEIARLEGELARCVAALGQVIAAAEADGDRADLGKALLDLAELLLDFRRGEAAEMVVGFYDQVAESPGFDREILAARLAVLAGRFPEAINALRALLAGGQLEDSRTRDRLVLHLAAALLEANRTDEARQLLDSEPLGAAPSIQARKLALGLRLKARWASPAAAGLLSRSSVAPIERLELLKALAELDGGERQAAQALEDELLALLLPALEAVWPAMSRPRHGVV